MACHGSVCRRSWPTPPVWSWQGHHHCHHPQRPHIGIFPPGHCCALSSCHWIHIPHHIPLPFKTFLFYSPISSLWTSYINRQYFISCHTKQQLHIYYTCLQMCNFFFMSIASYTISATHYLHLATEMQQAPHQERLPRLNLFILILMPNTATCSSSRLWIPGLPGHYRSRLHVHNHCERYKFQICSPYVCHR